MSLFCFLVVPFFIAFRRSVVAPEEGRRGLAPAFVLGLVVALLGESFVDVFPAGRFGFLRWVYLFIESAALPALLPLGAWWLLRRVKAAVFSVEATDFALIWLVPVCAVRAVTWTASGDPAELVLAPLLWLSIAVGLPMLIDAAQGGIGLRAFGAGAFAVLLPCLGATSSWAFFVNRPLIGFLAFAACAAPTAATCAVSLKAAVSASIAATRVAGGSRDERSEADYPRK